ncbi:MAG: hypothetical protein RLZZ67_308 [Candidatus Parcubacteria bacterium]|jgi:hypothetical protein
MFSKIKLIGTCVLIALCIYLFFVFDVPYRDAADSFTTCVGMGNPVMESYPRQCRDKNGTLFIEEVVRTSSTATSSTSTNSI